MIEEPNSVSLAEHLEASRLRIPQFSRQTFGLRGALATNGVALGSDVLVAPFNFLMGLPNFVLRLLAMILGLLRWRSASGWLMGCHIGVATQVQTRVGLQIRNDLLQLDKLSGREHEMVERALREPLTLYLQTRNVAADLTAGTLAALAGWFVFQQFTPGSVSAGSVVAQWAGKQHAASQFWLGETLGGWWYSVFPPSVPLWLVVLCFSVVMAVIAVVSAFSGLLHDPVQHWTGVHQRRLSQMLDAVEAAALGDSETAYCPKDSFYGRAYDLLDWLKGLMP